MTTDNPNSEESRLQAGQRLRQARDSAGISVEDLAAQLNLRASVINAIEACDYGKIDSEMFLKGYVRAYAARVGVNGDSVIRQLDQELEPARKEREAQVEANPLVSIERRRRLKKRIARVVALLLLLVVLVYVGSFYLASFIKEELGDEPAMDATSSMPRITDPASGPESVYVSPDRDESESLSSGQTTPESGAVPDDGAADNTGVISTLDSGVITPRDPEETAEGAEQTENDVLDDAVITASEEAPMIEDPDLALSAVDPVATPAPDVAEESPATTPVSQNRLQATFTDDCWVEVTDATGRTLVAALRRSGETLDITGTAPLRVVLGAVDAVGSVEFAGETVDLSRYTPRNNRVVMTLEP